MNCRQLHLRRNLKFQNLRRQQVFSAINHMRHLLIRVVQSSKSSHLTRLLREPQYPKPAKRTQLYHELHQPLIVGRNVIVPRVSQSLRRLRSVTSTRIYHLLYGKCLARIVNNIPHKMSSATMKTWKLMLLFLREKKLIGQTSTLFFRLCVLYFTFIWKLIPVSFFKCPNCQEGGLVGFSRRRTPRGRKAKTQERKRARSCSWSILTFVSVSLIHHTRIWISCNTH